MASYVIQHETLKAMADEVRVLADSLDEMNPNEMTANVAQANADVAVQADLIAQIRTALDGKASGSGGGGTEEIENIIDESGVLGTTDGTVTVTDKVEQLIDKANIEKFYYQRTSSIKAASEWFYGFNGEKLPRSNFVNATVVANFARNSTITDVDYYLNWGAEATSGINASNSFNGTVNLTHMVGAKMDKCINMTGFFADSAIEEVDEPFNLSSITQSSYLNNAFACSKLREVRFEENSIKWSITFTSQYLSDDSIESILKGLAPVETQQILTVHQTVYNKILDSEYLSELLFAAMDNGWDISY